VNEEILLLETEIEEERELLKQLRSEKESLEESLKRVEEESQKLLLVESGPTIADVVKAVGLRGEVKLYPLLDFHPLVSVSWGYDLIHDAERNTMWRWTARYTLKQSAAMVGDCDTIRQLAIAHGMPDERIVTFPWGINLERFTPTPQHGELASDTFSILSTRGWEPIYGVDILARAFVLAANSRPDMRLVMLGGGSMEAQLREILAEGGALEKVRFQGLVGTGELPNFFREADIYVSASHSDGTSISLLEALASGTPAIVSDIPGNREWIEPGVQGWLFPDGDAAALAQAITNAFDQRQKLPEMGRAARVLAEQRANWETNFPHLLRAYDLAWVSSR